MNKHLHALALLMLLIVIVVSVLGVLAVTTANSDLKIARRQADYASGIQDCTNQAQRWLAELKAGALLQPSPPAPGYDGPMEYKVFYSTVEKQFTDGRGHCLDAAVKVGSNGTAEIIRWKCYTRWEEAPDLELFDPDKE